MRFARPIKTKVFNALGATFGRRFLCCLLCAGICLGKGINRCLKNVHQHDGATLLQTSPMQPAAHDVSSSVSSSSAFSQRETEDAQGESCGLKKFILNHTEGPGINKWVHGCGFQPDCFWKIDQALSIITDEICCILFGFCLGCRWFW